jgi:SAM-dependent methyltransferase
VTVPPEIFDEDYLYFYGAALGPERSDADAALVTRLLSLRPGSRVLDVPCGEGRISGRLARQGCEVVGVDGDERLLALARERYPEAEFEHGDMRALPYASEFDAALNWFTSFGYFDPDTNDALLASYARALRPGGRLLIEMHNPWRLARLTAMTGGASGMVLERDGDLLADRVRYDEASHRSHTERFIVRAGNVRKLEFSLEQVPAPRLIGRLRHAGFSSVRLFGDGGAAFDPESRRLMAVAECGEPAPVGPQVSLREIDKDNVRAVCDLRLAPDQETYVAPSAFTVAEGMLDPHAWVRAIYADEDVVGVLALIKDREVKLVRFMIGAQHQGQGLGAVALRLLVDHVRTLPDVRELFTSCVPGPDSPADFYRAQGFEDTGRTDHGDDVLRLSL